MLTKQGRENVKRLFTALTKDERVEMMRLCLYDFGKFMVIKDFTRMEEVEEKENSQIDLFMS